MKVRSWRRNVSYQGGWGLVFYYNITTSMEALSWHQSRCQGTLALLSVKSVDALSQDISDVLWGGPASFCLGYHLRCLRILGAKLRLETLNQVGVDVKSVQDRR